MTGDKCKRLSYDGHYCIFFWPFLYRFLPFNPTSHFFKWKKSHIELTLRSARVDLLTTTPHISPMKSSLWADLHTGPNCGKIVQILIFVLFRLHPPKSEKMHENICINLSMKLWNDFIAYLQRKFFKNVSNGPAFFVTNTK